MICNADKLKKFISDVMKSAGLPEMDSKKFCGESDQCGYAWNLISRNNTYENIL